MKDKDRRSISNQVKINNKQSLKATCGNSVEVDWNVILAQYKLNPNISIFDINIEDEKKFSVFLWLLKKQMKQQFEMLFVKSYLQTFPSFINILNKTVSDSFDEILSRVSFYIQLESLEKDNILFRNGDKGDKFYIILNGKVAILVPKDIKVRMSERDYLKHLLKLRQMGENEILMKTIQTNRMVYKIDEETLEMFSCNPLKESNKVLAGMKTGYKKIVAGTSQYKDLMKFSQRMTNFGMNILNPLKTSVEDYINNTRPSQELCTNNKSIPEVTVWEYFLILTKQTGDTFGEVALEQISQKRTATIIVTEDCHFGYLTKEIYNDCIREANERTRKNNINFILNSEIFKGLNKQIFERKNVFNLFINCQFTQSEVLFYENTPAEYIYIIKSGEYQVIMNKTLHEINSIIKDLGGDFDEKNDSSNFQNDVVYNKYFSQRFKFKISHIKDKDIFGLSDYVYKNNYTCRVICSSSKGEAFKLTKHFYDNFAPEEKVLHENYLEFTKLKKKILLDKLKNFKKIKIASYIDKNKEKLIDINSSITNTINNDTKNKEIFYRPKYTSSNIITEIRDSFKKLNCEKKSSHLKIDNSASYSKNINLPSFETSFNKTNRLTIENKIESKLSKFVKSLSKLNTSNNENETKLNKSLNKKDSNKLILDSLDFLSDNDSKKILPNLEEMNNKFSSLNNQDSKTYSHKQLKFFFKNMKIRTNKYSQLAIQHMLDQQRLSNRRYKNSSNNIIVNRRRLKEGILKEDNSFKFKPVYQLKKSTNISNNIYNNSNDNLTCPKDKEILSKVIDRLVEKPKKERHYITNKKINVIDCLVVDRIIESYQTNSDIKLQADALSNIYNVSQSSQIKSFSTIGPHTMPDETKNPKNKSNSNKNVQNTFYSPSSKFTDKTTISKKDTDLTFSKKQPYINFNTIESETSKLKINFERIMSPNDKASIKLKLLNLVSPK